MSTPKKSHKKSAFLLKTFDILNNESYKHILDWNHDGIGFVIFNVENFANQVLPIYFKHSNFPSFIRQLNMYGFSKKRTIKNENYYFHPKFQRNQKELIGQIQRRVQKKSYKQTQQAQRDKQQKIPSEISIQLESKPYNMNQDENTESKQKKLYVDFYKLMGVNQTLMYQQISAIIGILADMKGLTSQSFTPQQEQINNMCLQYCKLHTNFHANLVQKAKNEIKGSEKYIKSSIIFDTKQTLHAMNGDVSHQ